MHSLKIQEHSGYRLVQIAGEPAADQEDAFRKDLFNACTQPAPGDLLVDLRGWTAAEADTFAFRIVQQQFKSANCPEHKIAILDETGRLEQYSPLQPSAPHRFCQVQVFDAEAPALEWLKIRNVDPPLELFRQSGALAVLQRYGLEAALSKQDDPLLWALALLRHWNAPDDPACLPDSLRFSIGNLPAGADGIRPDSIRPNSARPNSARPNSARPDAAQPGETPTVSSSGMETLETWYFERLDAQHLRIRPDAPPPPKPMNIAGMGQSFASLGLSGFGGLFSTTGFQAWSYLDISRPSLDEQRALVHEGGVAGPTVGSGETRWWARQADGNWQETEKVFSKWIS